MMNDHYADRSRRSLQAMWFGCQVRAVQAGELCDYIWTSSSGVVSSTEARAAECARLWLVGLTPSSHC